MPKKIIFTREELIMAAFEIFRLDGMAGVSARKIAAKLGCSTAPIYISFNNIDEIRNALLEKSLALLFSYTEKEYTSDIFLNIGVGMLEFAKEYGIIYRTLFFESNAYKHILDEFTERNLLQIKKERTLRILQEVDLKNILDKLTVFTHGMASLICAGMIEDTSCESLIKALMEAGGDVIGATVYRRGKMDEYLKLMEIKEDPDGVCRERL